MRLTRRDPRANLRVLRSLIRKRELVVDRTGPTVGEGAQADLQPFICPPGSLARTSDADPGCDVTVEDVRRRKRCNPCGDAERLMRCGKPGIGVLLRRAQTELSGGRTRCADAGSSGKNGGKLYESTHERSCVTSTRPPSLASLE